MDRVQRYFTGEPELYFVTLTEQADSGRDIMKDANRLRTRLKRVNPQLKAFWVKEFTKRGVRHLHCIFNMTFTKEELTQHWTRSTKGVSWHIDITPARSVRNPAGYMMKYMTKQLEGGDHGFKDNERRYGFWKPASRAGGDQEPTGAKSSRRAERGEPEGPGDHGGGREPEGLQVPERASDTIDITKLRGALKGKCEVELEPHWNQASKYWLEWYNKNVSAYGEPFMNYMSWATLTDINKANYRKLNFDSPSYDHIFTEVELYGQRGTDEHDMSLLREKISRMRVNYDRQNRHIQMPRNMLRGRTTQRHAV